MRIGPLALALASVACAAERAIAPQPTLERTYQWGCDHEGRCAMMRMPLLIIDGQPRQWVSRAIPGRSEDVASIEVLKGDKAVAVYGEEARDGIVVVTTTKAPRR